MCADQEVLSGHRIDVHLDGAVSPSINGVSICECESLSAQHSYKCRAMERASGQEKDKRLSTPCAWRESEVA